MIAPESFLRDHYVQHYPVEALRVIAADDQNLDALKDVSIDSLAKMVDCAEPAMQSAIFNHLNEDDRFKLLSLSSTRTTLHILTTLRDEERESYLAGLPAASREKLRQILSFPSDMAGHYMEEPLAHYRTTDTIGDALEKLRTSRSVRARSIYVLDERNILAGRVDIQDMALSDPTDSLLSVTNPVESFAFITSPRSELMDIFNQYRVDSIPLLDPDHQLVGVVRYASLFEAAEQSITGDFQKMVGVSVEEKALSSPIFAVKKRLPWLHINLLTAFLAAAVVGLFESTIAQFTALAILLPVVAGQSGNAGSQALAVTMRGLALREINLLKWRKVLVKEVQVGLIDGIVLAVTCGLGVFVWSQSIGLSIVIAIAMVISMIAAGISGALVPMTLLRFGQDPATASSIILTTVTDIAGFVAFLGTATLMSSML